MCAWSCTNTNSVCGLDLTLVRNMSNLAWFSGVVSQIMTYGSAVASSLFAASPRSTRRSMEVQRYDYLDFWLTCSYKPWSYHRPWYDREYRKLIDSQLSSDHYTITCGSWWKAKVQMAVAWSLNLNVLIFKFVSKVCKQYRLYSTLITPFHLVSQKKLSPYK